MAASLVGRKLGMYQITELLGQGGMATVYKGYREDIDRFVAVKVLPPHPGLDHQFIERFKLEARTIARLQHPHILPLYDYGVEDDIIYLVMAYVAGGSLSTLMDKGSVPLAEIERILRQVAGALDYAHRQGVIHRDIKPDNILLDNEGNVLLADFGIVKIVSGDSGSTNPALTQTGGLVGTPAYMAPEQGSGLANITPRADLYSLGVVVYEMLTGEPPYTADTPMQVVIKHITEPVPNPRDINKDLSPEMENVIQRALAKRPEDRYATVTEFADDFSRATRGEELLTHIPLSKTTKTPSPNQTLEITNGPTPTAYLTPPPPSANPTPQPTLIVQQGTNPLVLLGGFAIIAVLLIVVVLVLVNRTPTTVPIATIKAAENTPLANNTQVAAVVTQAPNFGSLNFSTKNSTGDTVTLQVQNLNPPGGDNTYVAWLKNTITNKTLKLGELTLNALGNGVLPPYSDADQRTLPTLFNAVIVTREQKNGISDEPKGDVAYSGSLPAAVMDTISAIYVTAPDGISSEALANTNYGGVGKSDEDSLLSGLYRSVMAEASIGQQHAGLAQSATTVGGMHLHNEHTVNIFMGTEVDYDGDGRGANPGFKKGVPLFLDDLEKVLNTAATAPGGSDALHGNIESVRICVANARKWVGQIVDIEKQMLKLDSVEAAVKIASQATTLAAAMVNGVDANGSGQVDPYEDECGLHQIESFGLLAGSMTLQQGPLAS